MRLPILRTIRDVAEYQLCTGCGVCAAISPATTVMVDDIEHGRRPRLSGDGSDDASRLAMSVCPGAGLSHTFDERDPALLRELRDAWGPVLAVWEGHAADTQIRRAGSSGGAATALALYCLEKVGMHGVLHVGAKEGAPYLNETVMSRTREQLLARTGSRYAPASPCEGLPLIEEAQGPCVFIGKPCDVAAAQGARKLRPQLDAKLGLTIAFFCAGTPSTRGTLELLKKAGVHEPEAVRSVRYRGNGWPGRWTVEFESPKGAMQSRSLSYEESWGFLQEYRQWRCYICPDHSGEFADIAVGDPWYRRPQADEPGSSLIVARTRRGLDALRAAAAAGYLVLEREDPTLLPRSQPNLLRSRGRLWGQMMALRLAFAPHPRFSGFPLARFWWSHLGVRQKLQSTLGTLRRVWRKSLYRRVRTP
jgi:coenzyme F420 hydrogenase subunit beta